MLVILGTFVPVIGVIATVILASVTDGRNRWIALLVIPAATLGVSFLIAEQVGRDGNLLFVLLFALLYVSLLAYYPALAVIGIVKWIRGRSHSVR